MCLLTTLSVEQALITIVIEVEVYILSRECRCFGKGLQHSSQFYFTKNGASVDIDLVGESQM